MAENSKIEWCDHTFNPWIGCTRVSPACDHCYAESLAKRYAWAAWGPGEARRFAAPSTWKQPEKWNRAAAAEGVRRRVFCSSLADVFDAEVPDEWRVLLFEKIVATPHLDWLLLTKRPQVAAKWFDAMPAPSNVWLGTTVENQKMADLRIPILLGIPGIQVRFLSMEPLLGAIRLDHIQAREGFYIDSLKGEEWHPGAGSISSVTFRDKPRLDWVIAGGESGPKARPSHPDWFRALRDQCAAAEVAYFFKQWGSWGPSSQQEWIDDDGSNRHMLVAPDGRHGDTIAYMLTQPPGTAWMRNLGKKAAGAELDGKLHREFPT